jgi:hypothetical protein
MERQTPDYVAEGCSTIREQLNPSIEARRPRQQALGHYSLMADIADAAYRIPRDPETSIDRPMDRVSAGRIVDIARSQRVIR